MSKFWMGLVAGVVATFFTLYAIPAFVRFANESEARRAEQRLVEKGRAFNALVLAGGELTAEQVRDAVRPADYVPGGGIKYVRGLLNELVETGHVVRITNNTFWHNRPTTYQFVDEMAD